MVLEMEQIQIPLKSGFEYHVKGGIQKAQFISLSEPKGRDISNCAIIRQIVTQATQEISEMVKSKGAQPSEDSENPTASEWMSMIYATGVDVNKLSIASKELLKSIAMADGEVKMTAPMIDELSLRDMEAAIGGIIENFIADSILEA